LPLCGVSKSAAGRIPTIPNTIPKFADLGLPSIIKTFSEWEAGLVIFIGVTGSGKTVCGAILTSSTKRREEIVTIETRELVHKSKKSMVVQREIGPMSTRSPWESRMPCVRRPMSSLSVKCETPRL
jgi:Tfp pilus assembly pilus retraction ATPase PilT